MSQDKAPDDEHEQHQLVEQDNNNNGDAQHQYMDELDGVDSNGGGFAADKHQQHQQGQQQQEQEQDAANDDDDGDNTQDGGAAVFDRVRSSAAAAANKNSTAIDENNILLVAPPNATPESENHLLLSDQANPEEKMLGLIGTARIGNAAHTRLSWFNLDVDARKAFTNIFMIAFYSEYKKNNNGGGGGRVAMTEKKLLAKCVEEYRRCPYLLNLPLQQERSLMAALAGADLDSPLAAIEGWIADALEAASGKAFIVPAIALGGLFSKGVFVASDTVAATADGAAAAAAAATATAQEGDQEGEEKDDKDETPTTEDAWTFNAWLKQFSSGSCDWLGEMNWMRGGDRMSAAELAQLVRHHKEITAVVRRHSAPHRLEPCEKLPLVIVPNPDGGEAVKKNSAAAATDASPDNNKESNAVVDALVRSVAQKRIAEDGDRCVLPRRFLIRYVLDAAAAAASSSSSPPVTVAEILSSIDRLSSPEVHFLTLVSLPPECEVSSHIYFPLIGVTGSASLNELLRDLENPGSTMEAPTHSLSRKALAKHNGRLAELPLDFIAQRAMLLDVRRVLTNGADRVNGDVTSSLNHMGWSALARGIKSGSDLGDPLQYTHLGRIFRYDLIGLGFLSERVLNRGAAHVLPQNPGAEPNRRVLDERVRLFGSNDNRGGGITANNNNNNNSNSNNGKSQQLREAVVEILRSCAGSRLARGELFRRLQQRLPFEVEPVTAAQELRLLMEAGAIGMSEEKEVLEGGVPITFVTLIDPLAAAPLFESSNSNSNNKNKNNNNSDHHQQSFRPRSEATLLSSTDRVPLEKPMPDNAGARFGIIPNPRLLQKLDDGEKTLPDLVKPGDMRQFLRIMRHILPLDGSPRTKRDVMHELTFHHTEDKSTRRNLFYRLVDRRYLGNCAAPPGFVSQWKPGRVRAEPDIDPQIVFFVMPDGERAPSLSNYIDDGGRGGGGGGDRRRGRSLSPPRHHQQQQQQQYPAYDQHQHRQQQPFLPQHPSVAAQPQPFVAAVSAVVVVSPLMVPPPLLVRGGQPVLRSGDRLHLTMRYPPPSLR